MTVIKIKQFIKVYLFTVRKQGPTKKTEYFLPVMNNYVFA